MLTFEDLAIDDTLDDLGRVCQYCFSPIALQRSSGVSTLCGVGLCNSPSIHSRLVHVRMISSVAKQHGYATHRVECAGVTA